MKRSILAATMLTAMLTTQASAQKYYARQYLVGLKQADAEEPAASTDPVGPCPAAPYAYNAITGGTVTIGRYVATRIPAQMCAGGDVIAPSSTRHLMLQNDENMVIYFGSGGNGGKWSSGTQYAGSRTLATQPDGNVQLLRNDGSVVWQTGTTGNAGAYAAMAQSGSMIVVSRNGKTILWSTNTDDFPAANVDEGTVKGPDNIPATVVPGTVERNEVVPSPNGRCKFSVQSDSNLVIYKNGSPIWASGTQYSDGYRLVTLANGNVQFNRANGSTVFSTNTAGNAGARMRMQDDCDLAVYATDGKTMLWHSNTSSKDVLVAG